MRKVLLLLFAISLLAGCGGNSDGQVIFLVRHAEKADDGTKDPPLNEAGQARADALARLLTGSKISRVYSTDYQRTRMTAEPVAAALGVEVEIYDPRKPGDLVVHLKDSGDSALIVGHSNTTPEMVGLLGGDPSEPMGDDEYGRLYRVLIKGERISTDTAQVPGGQGVGPDSR